MTTTVIAEGSVTVGELAREYSCQDWQVRRCVDAVAGPTAVPRIARARMITPEIRIMVLAELLRRGWLREVPA